MRRQLATKVGVRKIFTGVFERYGFIKDTDGNIKSKILLRDIKVKGIIVANHAWIDKTNEFETIGALSKGDKIMFKARVLPYARTDQRVDLGLEFLTNVKRCIYG